MARGLLIILTEDGDELDTEGALTRDGVMAAISKVTILPHVSHKQLTEHGGLAIGDICGKLASYWLEPSLEPIIEEDNNENN